jgi:hypothetical protein
VSSAVAVDTDTLAAIGHSYAIYARACDEKRYDLLARVFTPGALLDYRVAGHEFACRGGDAAANFAAFLERCYWTHHLIAAPMVERCGERLRATARVTATHLQRRVDGSTNRWLVRGSYHDTFERHEGNWLIVRRDCFCLDADGDFEAEGIEHYPVVAWAGTADIGANDS